MSAGRRLQSILIFLYCTALIVCFLCDLAINGRFTWSLIVLCALGIAFSVTTLPFFLRRRRLAVSALAVTVLLGCLLLACGRYAEPGWFVRYAAPIAAYPVVCAWLLLLAASLRPLHWFFRSALMSFVCGGALLTVNVWVAAVLDGEARSFGRYFITQFGAAGTGFWINGALSLGFFAYSVVGIVLGCIAAITKKT